MATKVCSVFVDGDFTLFNNVCPTLAGLRSTLWGLAVGSFLEWELRLLSECVWPISHSLQSIPKFSGRSASYCTSRSINNLIWTLFYASSRPIATARFVMSSGILYTHHICPCSCIFQCAFLGLTPPPLPPSPIECIHVLDVSSEFLGNNIPQQFYNGVLHCNFSPILLC